MMMLKDPDAVLEAASARLEAVQTPPLALPLSTGRGNKIRHRRLSTLLSSDEYQLTCLLEFRSPAANSGDTVPPRRWRVWRGISAGPAAGQVAAVAEQAQREKFKYIVGRFFLAAFKARSGGETYSDRGVKMDIFDILRSQA